MSDLHYRINLCHLRCIYAGDLLSLSHHLRFHGLHRLGSTRSQHQISIYSDQYIILDANADAAELFGRILIILSHI
jgi:hypothetical protein